MSGSVVPGPTLSWRLLRYSRLLSLAAVVLLVDQLTKAWIAYCLPYPTYGVPEGAIPVIHRFFYIVHVGNTGAAWSVLSGRSLLLAALAGGTLVAIFLFRKSLGLESKQAQLVFGLICGGIIGNLVDRLARGHVVDFLDFHFGSYIYPTFNIADSAICIGVFLYILDSLRSPKSPV